LAIDALAKRLDRHYRHVHKGVSGLKPITPKQKPRTPGLFCRWGSVGYRGADPKPPEMGDAP